MFSFILIAAVITLLTLLLLARPLLKKQNPAPYDREAQNIHFARERLQELEQQFTNASISETDYEALKMEIESNLAQDIDFTEQTQTSSIALQTESNGLVIALLCVLIPIGGFFFYKSTGTPAALSPQVGGAAQEGRPDIQAMLTSLELKLQENPNDTQGWTMLARSYQALSRFQDSLDANNKVLALGGGTPDVYTAMADSSAFLANGVLAGQPIGYVRKALALQENHPQALWLAGLSEAQAGNSDSARQYWNKLLPQLASAPQQQQELQAIIDQSFASSSSLTPTEQSASPKQNGQSTATPAREIKIHLSIEPSLASEVNPEDIVFVFARAKQGPPAPLAVKKMRAADLPTNITLSDNDAMMDQFKLSRFNEVVVSARVAKSGNPIAQSGDLQSVMVETTTTEGQLIKLSISQIIN